MNKRIALVGGVLAVAATTTSQAQSPGQFAGAEVTHGGAAPHERPIATSGNPATPSLGDRRVRAGVLANIGVGYELGDADDFDRDIEDIADRFDELEGELKGLDSSTSDPDALEDLVNEIVSFENDSNDLVSDLSDKAYAKVSAGLTGPGAPLSVRSETLNGVVTLDYGVNLDARIAVESSGDAFSSGLDALDTNQLDQDSEFEVTETAGGFPLLRIDFDGDGTFDDEFVFEPNDEAGVAVQGGIIGRFGAGYSREVWASEAGALHAGAKASVYRVTLARSGYLLDQGNDTREAAEDEFEDNQETNRGVGIDVGAMWVADNFSIGGTASNLNEPSFDYPDPCENGSDTQSCRFFEANPEAARNGSSWTMERQLTLEGALHTQDRRWLLTGRLDANEVTDATGDEYQWAAVGASFMPHSAWIPSPRVGYRTNLAGEELSYVSAGATFFRFLHLDVARSLEDASVDGNEGPRSMLVSLGTDLQF